MIIDPSMSQELRGDYVTSPPISNFIGSCQSPVQQNPSMLNHSGTDYTGTYSSSGTMGEPAEY